MTLPPPPTIRLDFETYSEAGYVATPDGWEALPGASGGKKGLPIVGAKVYVEHPTFEILTLSYYLGGAPQRWKPNQPPPFDLFARIAQGWLVSGWNSGGFEVKVWAWLVEHCGWPPVPTVQWRDTMAEARAWSLPGKLEKAAEVLNTKHKKNKEGKRLLDKFSVPRKPTKNDPRRRIRPEDDPEDAEHLYEYCDEDVLAEMSVSAVIPSLTASELAVWQCDRQINDRGVQIDIEGIENCVVIIEQAHAQYNAELIALTGGAVSKASEIKRLTEWLDEEHDVQTASLDEEHLTELLERTDLPRDARRALEIRAAIGSASVKKVFSMKHRASRDGRLHDLFNYHAARTGRVTGDGPQPTNLPNSAGVYAMACGQCGKHYGTHRADCPWCACSADRGEKEEWSFRSAEFALETIATRSLDWVEFVWGDAMLAVSGCLRALFIAAPGHDLICSDYSAIEAVVIAELAGEEWRQEVFRTHGKIYEMSAAKISGVPFDDFMIHAGYTPEQLLMPEWWKLKPENKGSHHPLRKTIGKIAELASGFQGWIGSWVAFGADKFMTEEEMKNGILNWRKESPAIVEMWGGQERNWKPELYGVEGAFVAAVMSPGAEIHFRGMRFQMRGTVAYVRLVSGRELAYHNPILSPSSRRRGTSTISYEGWNSNPKNGPMGWLRMETWGGRLVENIVQATARDLQWHGILALEAGGYPIVLHVYDEDVAEVPENAGSVEEFENTMSAMPSWAEGWPVRANGGWRGKRYRK
jgi:DNA polymerase